MISRSWGRRAEIIGIVILALLPGSSRAERRDWMSDLEGKGTLNVVRLTWEPTLNIPFRSPGRGDFVPAAQAPIREADRRRLLTLLTRREGVQSGADCRGYCLDCGDQVAFEIDFGPGAGPVHALALFRERRVLYETDEGRIVGSRDMGEDDAFLFTALEHALTRRRVTSSDMPPRAPAPGSGVARDPRLCVFVDRAPADSFKVPAVYPDLAKSAHVEGTVVIRAWIGLDGRVLDTTVIKSIPMLDESAREAARQQRFAPALCGGRPVAVWMDLSFTYKVH